MGWREAVVVGWREAVVVGWREAVVGDRVVGSAGAGAGVVDSSGAAVANGSHKKGYLYYIFSLFYLKHQEKLRKIERMEKIFFFIIIFWSVWTTKKIIEKTSGGH